MLRALLDDILCTLLPARCAGCGRQGSPVCAECAATLVPAARVVPPAGIDWWVSCFAYQGVAREVVARAKYRDERSGLRWFVPHLARAAAAAPERPDVVTWIPASAARRGAHGVDHGELIARAVAAGLRLPVRSLLVRDRGVPQTGLDARTRRIGPALRATGAASGYTILVVDDVATTGGSLASAARALRARGARAVIAATIARTPRPEEAPRAAAYTSASIPR